MTKRLAAWAAILAIGLAGGAGRASDAALAEEGNREYAAGDFAKALEVYDRALENAAPGHRAPLLFNRANALYRLGRLAEAEEAYREAAAADGGLSRDSAFNQGNAAWQAARERMEKEPQKALDDLMRGEALYRRALEQAPGDPDSAYNLDLVRREIQKLRQRLPPPQQQQQNQEQKQDKKQQDQKQEQKQGQKQGDQGQPDQQKKPEDSPNQQGQQKDQNQSPADQNAQDKKEQRKDEHKPSQQNPQGGQGEQKDAKNAPQDAQKPGERPDKQQSPDDPGQQGQPKPQAGERPEPPQDQPDAGKDGKEGEKQGEKTPQEEPADQKDGQNSDADGQEKPDARKDAPKRQAAAQQAQGSPRDKDDPDAKTAEQILQREKEDRERRAKARRRHAPVEKDW